MQRDIAGDTWLGIDISQVEAGIPSDVIRLRTLDLVTSLLLC